MATPDENLATLLEIVADVAADRPAVAHRDRTLSWREFEDRASRLARHLADSGVGPGARVGIALYNGPEYLESVFALMKLRAVPVNVNYRYRERELLEILGDAAATGLIFDSALDDRMAGVAREMPGLTTLLRLASPGPDGEPAAPPGAEWGDLKPGDYASAVAAAEPMPRIARGGDDEWVLFTGGTTGRPKGVRAPHRWLIGVAENNGPKLLGRDVPGDVADMPEFARENLTHPRLPTSLVAPPLIHGTGMYCALGTLLCGGLVVLLPNRSYRPQDIIEVIPRHRVTDMCLVGDAFARPLADALDEAAAAGRPADLSSLRRILSVGVAWSAEVKHRLLQHCDAVLQDSVAASEGGPFAVSYTKRGDRAITSRFELFPGARVVTADGEDVVPGSGQVGYLAAPAPEEIGYLGDPVKSAETFRMIRGERYSVPGDMAILEADGSLVLLGRDSRVINTGGEKVFAEEVEQVICAHPDVEDANVVGMPDERWGNRIVAVVALRPGAELTAEQIREHVGNELADYKRPREVVFVPAIQRTLTGKSDLAWARKAAAGEA
jgi:acyl-CoA synthetase (AMP-forming)/AMP-acid ligase II